MKKGSPHQEARKRIKRIADYIKAHPDDIRSEVCQACKVTPFMVYQACCQYGVKHEASDRSQGESATMRLLRIIGRLQDRKLTYETIGKEFNVTRQRIQQIHATAIKAGIRLYGWKRLPKGKAKAK